MSSSAIFQSKRVAGSRKTNRFALVSLVILLLAAALFVVAPSKASRAGEKKLAAGATQTAGPRANSVRRGPEQPNRVLSPMFLPAFLSPAPGDPDLVETFASA